MFIRGILSAAIAIAACSSSLQGADASAASQSLTESGYEAALADGATFVKFYSSQCEHSQKLAPVWEQLAVDHQDWKRTRGFKFAEVDCLTQQGVCEDNDVVSYPTMQLFYKGKSIEKYSKRRTPEALKKFVDNMSAEYINAPSNVKAEEVSDIKINALGQVINLDQESYGRRTRFGPWLIEYYAPWCGHCKSLAPIYHELAGALKGHVNVAQVDCTKNEEICYEEDIQGYPTIKLHQYGESVEYRKMRSLEAMADFALGAIVPSVKSITPNDLEEIRNTNDVTFVYIHDSKTNPEITALIEKKSQIFFEEIALHGSDDPELAHQLSVTSPSLVALKDNRQFQYKGSLTDAAAVQAWIKETRTPLVMTLTNENTGTVLSRPGWVVLGLFDLSKPSSARRELIETARRYHDTIGERELLGEEPLRFVILDASKWESYLRGAYGLTLKNLPVALVVNSREELFYPYGLDGHRVPLEQEQLLTYITQIETGVLTSRSMVSFSQKIFRILQSRFRVVTQFSTAHPMIAMFTSSAFLMAIMRKFGGEPEAEAKEEEEEEKKEEGGKDIKQD